MKPRLRSAAAIVALAVIGLLAGCTTTVRGHGAPAAVPARGSASGIQSRPTFPAATGPTTTGPTTTGPTTTGPTTTGPSTSLSTRPPTSPATTPVTRAELAAQLGRLSPSQGHVLVTVPGAVEAVSYDQAGHLTFWRHTAGWARVGHSSYPYDPAFGPPAAVLTGARLTGMAHATFIASGYFSGDSSVNAAAYTTGAEGWGAIKAEPNANIGPSGQGVGFSAIGLANDFAFVGGLLMSADCSDVGPIAACAGTHRVLKYWRWAGSDFVLDHRAGLPH